MADSNGTCVVAVGFAAKECSLDSERSQRLGNDYNVLGFHGEAAWCKGIKPMLPGKLKDSHGMYRLFRTWHLLPVPACIAAQCVRDTCFPFCECARTPT